MTTLEKIIFGVCAAVLAMCAGIQVSNYIYTEYHAEDIAETIRACEADGLNDCHAEAIYSGLSVVDFEVIGRAN